MKTEKILLSFVAVVIGLIVAGVGFYIFQSTKIIPQNKLNTVKLAQPTPTPPTVLLTVDTPQDESTTSNKTLTVSGKTDANNTLIVSTPTGDQVIKPSSQGTYSTSATITDGENEIYITAIAPNGTQTQKIITVTYTTESF